MKIEPGGSGDVPEIPDGLYPALITQAQSVHLETPDAFGNSEKIEIQVSFVDSNNQPQTLEPRVNAKWGEKATLFKIAEAAGLNPDPNQTFDTDDLIERKVNVLVQTAPKGPSPPIKT